MPILQDYENNNLSGGLTGNINTSYRYFKEGYHLLKPGQASIVVPATEELVNRAIMIKLYSGESPVKLYWGVKNVHPKPLNIFQTYIDTSDGGNALIAESEGEAILEILVRQNIEIDYRIGNYSLLEGDDMPVELVLRPIIQTGELYSMPDLPFPTQVGAENLSKILDSNNGQTTGTKVWSIDQFQPGKSYNFSINTNNVVATTRSIIVNLTPIEVIMKALAAFDASDNQELEQEPIAPSLIGWVKSKSYYSEIAVNTNTFTLKPSHTRYLLSFDAPHNISYVYTDTAITSYAPNVADPTEGGMFTFLGF